MLKLTKGGVFTISSILLATFPIFTPYLRLYLNVFFSIFVVRLLAILYENTMLK